MEEHGCTMRAGGKGWGGEKDGIYGSSGKRRRRDEDGE